MNLISSWLIITVANNLITCSFILVFIMYSVQNMLVNVYVDTVGSRHVHILLIYSVLFGQALVTWTSYITFNVPNYPTQGCHHYTPATKLGGYIGLLDIGCVACDDPWPWPWPISSRSFGLDLENRVRSVASTVLDGFFLYLAQIITIIRGCVACYFVFRIWKF